MTNRTVRLPCLLLKHSLTQLPKAERTHKVFRVKLAVQSSDAATRDGLSAGPTQSALSGVIVQGTEGPTVQLLEATICKRLQAVLREMQKEGIGNTEWRRMFWSDRLGRWRIHLWSSHNSTDWLTPYSLFIRSESHDCIAFQPSTPLIHSPHRQSSQGARFHWLQTDSSPSLALHSRSIWVQRGGRNP